MNLFARFAVALLGIFIAAGTLSRSIAGPIDDAIYDLADPGDLHAILDLANRGHAEAQLNPGLFYFGGLPVLQDYVGAHMWLNLAAAKGHKVGRYRRTLPAARRALDRNLGVWIYCCGPRY